MGDLDFTSWLNRLRRGSAAGAGAPLPEVYERLRAIAERSFRSQPKGQTLDPTSLIHEAYLQLFDPGRVEWRDRAEFFGLAAKVMRDILVDHARRRRAQKRGGSMERITLDAGALGTTDAPVDVLDVHEALEDLKTLDERQSRVVELKYFAGMDTAETAVVLGVAERTVERDWRAARAWLLVRLAR